jgi:hypothetical protein
MLNNSSARTSSTSPLIDLMHLSNSCGDFEPHVLMGVND